MQRMNLREAAERTSRSITTLRRYIRGGRLRADKRPGRFGPEYFVSVEDLADAGLVTEPVDRSEALLPRAAPLPQTSRPAERSLQQDAVPLSLFQELQMKHEQLLVQYGMVRAGGLRVMELQGELEAERRKLEESRNEAVGVRKELQRNRADAERQLRDARLELEGRGLEIAALQEKVRALEMLTRNAVTTETIERQFESVIEQSRRVDALAPKRQWRSFTRPTGPVVDPADDIPEH